MRLKDQLISYLFNKKEWVHKGEILDKKWYYTNCNKTFMQNTIDRELRRAEEESKIAVKKDPIHKGNMYKYLPKEIRERYIPTSLRTDKNILFKDLTTNIKKL